MYHLNHSLKIVFFLVLALGARVCAGQGSHDGAESGALAEKSFTLKVAAMGDIMLGTENRLPPDAAAGFFREVKPFLKDRDVVFGNLEGPLTDRGAPTKVSAAGRSYCFRTPPAYGRRLKDAGFNIVSLANNHANDYGHEGRGQTIEVLEELGIAHTGAPGQVTYLTLKGRRTAFIGLAPNLGCQDINDIPGAVALVKKVLAEDPKVLVVVSMHGGAEGSAHMSQPIGPEVYLGERRGDLVKLAHALVDAGADLVLGHGPHVPRALEVYRNRLIAYSLGNFATASGINVQGATGLAPLLLAELDGEGKLLNHRIVSFRQLANQGPRRDAKDEARQVIESLSRELEAALAGRR
ncbi:MAG: CapA family protein [Candidatus Accumulibacter sp.]|jgi:hypothetical protein|nr:CapA family protein [Accumulibacter sp.]